MENSRNDDELLDCETREDEHEMLRGVLLPACLAVLVAANLVTQTIWIPGRRGSMVYFHSHSEPLAFFGFLFTKIGIGASLFVWFWMANRQRFDRYTQVLLLIAISLACVGLLLLALYAVQSILTFP